MKHQTINEFEKGDGAPLFFNRIEHLQSAPSKLKGLQSREDIDRIRSRARSKDELSEQLSGLSLSGQDSFSVLYRYTGVSEERMQEGIKYYTILLESLFFETFMDGFDDLRYLAATSRDPMIEGTILSVKGIASIDEDDLEEKQWKASNFTSIHIPSILHDHALLYIFEKNKHGLLAASAHSNEPILIRNHLKGSLEVGDLCTADLVRSNSGWIFLLNSLTGSKKEVDAFIQKTRLITTSHPYSSLSPVKIHAIDDETRRRIDGLRLGDKLAKTKIHWNILLETMLIGSRIRDWEQKTVSAIITSLTPLKITFPPKTVRIDQFTVSLIVGGNEEVPLQVSSVFPLPNKSLIVTCQESDRLSKMIAEKYPGKFTGVVVKAKLHGAMNTVVVDVLNDIVHRRPIYNGFIDRGKTSLMKYIYQEPEASQDFARPSCDLISLPKIDGTTVTLNGKQSEVVNIYSMDDVPGIVVMSPPGSGKTTAAAAMTINYKGWGTQLLLSTANVPVFNMAKALDSYVHSDFNPIHLVSLDRSDEQNEEEKSPFDIALLIRNYRKWAKTDKDVKIAKEFIEFDDQFEEDKHEEDPRKKLNKTQLKKLKKERASAYTMAMNTMMKCKPPNVIFATLDMILLKLTKIAPTDMKKKKINVLHDQLKKTRRIIIDEASQMTESALNCLMVAFPEAQIVLIGDKMQMPPFRYQKGDMIQEWAAKSALDVAMSKKNVAVIKLNMVYRAPQTMIEHYSQTFYHGKLESGKPEEKTKPLISSGFEDKQCVLITVSGKSAQSGTSKMNNSEIKALERVIKLLKKSGYGQNDVMIIAYYEAQRKLAEAAVPEGFEVLTVDASQGREKPIVIVLTTASEISTSSTFIRCPLRCNVALSRHQRALFVLGTPSLLSVEPWSRVCSTDFFSHYTIRS